MNPAVYKFLNPERRVLCNEENKVQFYLPKLFNRYTNSLNV